MNKKSRSVCTISCATVMLSAFGCTPIGGTELIASKPATVQAMAINPSDATAKWEDVLDSSLVDTRPEGFDVNRELNIVAACLGDDKVPQDIDESGAVIIAAVANEVISYILDKVEKELAKEIEQYTATYAASTTVNPVYSPGESTPALHHKCLRFVRTLAQKDVVDGNSYLAFDLIAQLRLAPGNEAIQIRPLRLFYAAPQAKGSEFSTVVSLSSTSFWLQKNTGKTQQTFDTTIIKVKRNFDDKDETSFKYFDDAGWDSAVTVPLLPWSSNKDAYRGGNAHMTFTVAEAGRPPKHLELMAKVFKSQKEAIATKMSEAVQGLLTSK